MRITETPDRLWQPWEIEADEGHHPVRIRPECRGLETTGMIEIEFSYPDYSSWHAVSYAEQTHSIQPEVLAEVLRRMGWRVEKL